MNSDQKDSVKKLQKELKKWGLYNGEIDGDPGPLTASALHSWHTKDGYMPKWMQFAIGELGVSELYGVKRNNPRIVHYHSYTGLGAENDEVAWCASFVNCCLIEGAGIKGTGSASAASFKTYGHEVDPKTYGAILLIETNTGSHRHVFFNAGYHNEYIFGLGGNQSNAVNIQLRNLSSIKEARFPIIN